MKQYLFGMIALTAVIASCSSDEVVKSEENNLDNQISFTTYSNITSKGNPVDDNVEFMTDGYDFGVVAFLESSSSPYMGSTTSGAKIVYSSGWVHDDDTDMRYWPSKELDFFAYSPHSDGNRAVSPTITSAGIVITDYTVDSDEAKHEDFMYATALDQTMPAGDDKSVNLHFSHGLVQVHFTGNTAASNMYVDIEANGITMHNIFTKGTFTLPVTGCDDAAWSLQNTLGSYTLTSNDISFGGASEKNVTITLADKSSMLIPQTFSAWDPTSGAATADSQTGAYVTINCRIYTADSIDAEDSDKTFLVGDASTYTTIYIPISSDIDNTTWEAGKNIHLGMVFGGGYTEDGDAILDPITFTSTMTTWGDTYPSVDL